MTEARTPYDVVGERLLAGKLDRIRAFWDGFSREADALDAAFSSGSGDIVEISQRVMAPLSEVAPDLMWEFGPSDRGHSLCITPEWRNGLRPLAQAVVAMAPDLPRWRFTGARGGNDAALFEQNFQARFNMPITLERIEVAQGKDNKVQMTGFGMGSAESLGNQVLAVGTYLLGEETDWTWFGGVETKVLKSGGFLGFGAKHEVQPFETEVFRADFLNVVEEIEASRRDAAFRDMDPYDREAILLQVPSMRDGTGRTDLFTFQAPDSAYAEAALRTTRFSSENHSRFGEWFMFVRIPRNEEHPFDQVSDRGEIEDELHAVLSSAGLGGQVGAGHGHDAVYIDVATTDVDAGPALIAETLADRTFFDDATLHFLEAGLTDIALPLTDFAMGQPS